MRSLLIMVVVVVSVVDAIAQQSMASLLSLARECLLTVYFSKPQGLLTVRLIECFQF